MVAAFLKLKRFVKNIGEDLPKDHPPKSVHLKSAPSTESIAASEENDKPANELASIDYQQYNHKQVLTLEAHIRLNHEALSQVKADCPWCNRYYFDWLVERGLLTFVENIEHQHDNVAQSPTPLLPAFEEIHRTPFRFFNGRQRSNKQARKREYDNQKKGSNWMEKGIEAVKTIMKNSVVEVADYAEHNQFAKLPRSQGAAREWITGNCMYNPEELDPLPAENNLFILPNSNHMRGPELPKYLVMRFDKVIPQDIQKKIWDIWVKLRLVLRRFEKKKNTRDQDPQAHFGMWRHYRAFVYMISDTCNQSKEALELIKEFLTLIKLHIVPKMWALLQRYDPETLERHIRVRDGMAEDKDFVNTMYDFPHVDFGGIFYAMAVKDGGSQKIHLDWMDHQGTYAWVINIGPEGWEGGDLCLPQLGKRIPTRPGQIIAFQGRYLAHCAAPTIGNRLAITCFSDRSLMGSMLTNSGPSHPPKSQKKRSRNPETCRKRSIRGSKKAKV